MLATIQVRAVPTPLPHLPRRQNSDQAQQQINDNFVAAGLMKPGAGQKKESSDFQQSQAARMAPVPMKERRISMLAAKGRESRRERTFIGSQCAVCEEPLEHILRGERILQFSCGHVSHEACFYEYTREIDAQQCPTCDAPLRLDPSRGTVSDANHLNKHIRAAAAATPDQHHLQRERERQWDAEAAPAPSTSWDPDQLLRNEKLLSSPPMRPARPTRLPSADRYEREFGRLPDRSRTAQEQRPEAHSVGPHGRNGSGETRAAPTIDYGETNATGRRHDYDVQSMESSLSASRPSTKNPIPPPIVTVRSEFPTLSRSRQMQSLTCLVTVEVLDGKWQANPEDIRGPPPSQQQRPPMHEHTPSHQPSQHSTNTGRQPSTRAREQTMPTPQMEALKQDLFQRVENWHGLDFSRFGRLLLHGTVRVGKDKQAWQELECYLFSEMLICVKEKKAAATDSSQQWTESDNARSQTRCALKGSILIKKHLQHVEHNADHQILTLSLSVAELPYFHLQFAERNQLEQWRKVLSHVEVGDAHDSIDEEHETSCTDEDDYVPNTPRRKKRIESMNSSTHGAARSPLTAPTEYTNSRAGPQELRLTRSPTHVPVDIVVVVPVSLSMQGLKINLLRDALRFIIANLSERDRMGLVTFGSGTGGMPLVGMTNKYWNGWQNVLASIRPQGSKAHRADVVDGANVAMDLLMQRKSSNPLSTILLISDSATADTESVDFVVSRAEAAKISIHSFGLGLTHKPDTMIELSTRTKASYTYVKDWMMLRECLAGCVGSLQSISHQNVKLKLRLPEGSPAKFVKISGALQITKRATGRDAEASLGDLHFGDKRDILVQLAIPPDASMTDSVTSDPWQNIISNLEALSGPVDNEDGRSVSVEEVPLIQADVSWGDILREGTLAQLARPSLLAITMLPPFQKGSRPQSPPIPPHPSVVQRRMELLTSDMLTRALTLISRGQHDRASHLLSETRSILKGLGKGSLPPLPPAPTSATMFYPNRQGDGQTSGPAEADIPLPDTSRTPSPPRPDVISPFSPAAGIDPTALSALDHELGSSLEWISHPAVFNRDSRKAVLQAIGVISSQRAFTFRSPVELLWSNRVAGVKRMLDKARDWRETVDESLVEED